MEDMKMLRQWMRQLIRAVVFQFLVQIIGIVVLIISTRMAVDVI